MPLEQRVFRSVAKALHLSARRSTSCDGTWGRSIKGAAAASNFVCAEFYEGQEGSSIQGLLELEGLLQENARSGRRSAALLRSYLAGKVALPDSLRQDLKADDNPPLDVGFSMLRMCASYDELIEQLLQDGYLEPPAVKRRKPDTGLLFCAGDVLQHRFFGRCVVVGWSETCPMGEAWIASNHIRENLVLGAEQPFYHVLLERDSVPRCVSQENVALDKEPRTFHHFANSYYFEPILPGGHFEPTKEMTLVYPDDNVARRASRDFRTLVEAREPPYTPP